MKRYFLFSVIMLLSAPQSLFAQNLSASNQFIWADVDQQSGLVSVFLPIGRPAFDGQLSFYDHSYFTCHIDSTYFTNNEARGTFPAGVQFLTDGISVLVKGTNGGPDTARMTWKNKNGVDIIQDIYPVAFTKSGQIVYKWKFFNHGTSAITVACQYLEDVQITDPTSKQAPNSNDGPTILTRWSYKPIWQQWPTPDQPLPWFYIGFLFDIPNTPSFDPGLSGMGYMDYGYPLNLIKPSRMTIGDWFTMASSIFGPPAGGWPIGTSYGNPPQEDNAVLIEFPAQTIAVGKTVEVGKTSYGTGEYEKCEGNLFSIDFYPHHLTWSKNPLPGAYTPDSVHVEKFVIDGDQSISAANTFIKLTVDNSLQITDSAGKNNLGKSQIQPTSGTGTFIGAGAVSYFNWYVRADPALLCTGPILDTLSFTATCSICNPGFLDALGNQCDMPITLDCAESDVDPPLFSIRKDSSLFKYDTIILTVGDSRPTDRGLQSITWSKENGTDSTKFTITIDSAVKPCLTDKANHVVTVSQHDSTIGGCFDFTFTDCLGHQDYTAVCLSAHPFEIFYPDLLPPVFTLITESGSRNLSLCSSHIDSFQVTDNRLHDSGMCSLDTIAGSVSNMMFVKPQFNQGDPVVRFTIKVLDSMVDGRMCIRATDCSKEGNVTDTCLTYCAPAAGGVNQSSITALSLEANHPNPFSHLTTFQYYIPEYLSVKLYLFDELGKEMSRIVDYAQRQGSYTIDFDGSKLPSGSYIVRLESGGKVVSRKIIIQR